MQTSVQKADAFAGPDEGGVSSSVPPSSTVSCDLVTGGADSGEPSRPRDVRDISPGHPAVTRSLEETRNASEKVASRLRSALGAQACVLGSRS